MFRQIVFATGIYLAATANLRAQSSFSEFYDYLTTSIQKACAAHQDCLRLATSFAWFIWNNREQADLQFNAVKCLGYSAVQRGYIWSPISIWDDLTPTEVQSVAVEVCNCVIGYWGREPLCRQALFEGKPELLLQESGSKLSN